MLRWIQRHQTLSAGILTAVAIIAAAVIGLWNSSTQPTIKQPTSDASVQPDRAETSAAPGPLATATKPQPEPAAAPGPCESIDRTDQGVLAQSIFDIRDSLKDMIVSHSHTMLEMNEIADHYHGLRVIDCGYISDMMASSRGGLYVAFDNKTGHPDPLKIRCLFNESWKNKIRTMDRTRRVLFEGVVTTDSYAADIVLEDCSLLKVE